MTTGRDFARRAPRLQLAQYRKRTGWMVKYDDGAYLTARGARSTDLRDAAAWLSSRDAERAAIARGDSMYTILTYDWRYWQERLQAAR